MFLLNPAFVYVAVWSLVLGLYELGLSGLLAPLRVPTIVLVAGTSAAFLVGWTVESLPSYGRLAATKVDVKWLSDSIMTRRVARRLVILWILFALGNVLELAIFHGAPGLGLLGIGPRMAYTDYGIHGLHGFMNAIFFAAGAVAFARILLGAPGGKLALLFVSLAYPLMTMSREVLISGLLQYVFIYFSIRKPSARMFIGAGIFFAVTLLVFGYLGDLRTGRDNIIGQASPSFEYPDWLPSAFIWVYIYLCTPLNNVNYNIDVVPHYFPIETIGTFIPSLVRDKFLSSFGGPASWDLVTATFNVSSLLQYLLVDFGVPGSIVFTLFCGIGFARLSRVSSRSPAAFFVTIVVLHGIALSFFTNMLFSLISAFEVVTLIWLVSRGARR